MKLVVVPPAKALLSKNKAFYRQSVKREQVHVFKKGLTNLFERLNEKESEEHLKNIVADFIKEICTKGQYEVNTKERKDLVIHNGKTSKDTVGVIIEAKKPSNSSEMISEAKPNVKALQELVLYYMHERLVHENKELKHLIINNVFEWYIFDAVDFEKCFFENKKFRKEFQNWHGDVSVSNTTDHFYTEIAKKFIDNEVDELYAIHFNINDLRKRLDKGSSESDESFIDLYKIFTPDFLLKLPYANDSNKLNKDFYNELLHIIGLEEVKDNGKKIISRKSENKRDEGSLLENTIQVLETEDCLYKIRDITRYGHTKEEQLFSAALELCIT
jgi:hypothetical protein